MSFAKKPNESKDVQRLRAEYEKKAQEVRDTKDPASIAKLRDEKQKLFNKVVEQVKGERREHLAATHKTLEAMGRYKSDATMAKEKAQAEAAAAARLARER